MKIRTRLAAAAVLCAVTALFGPLAPIGDGIEPAFAQQAPAHATIGIVRIDPKDQLVIEGRGEPGSHVSVLVDGSSVGSVSVGSSGRWRITVSSPGVGSHRVSVRGHGSDSVSVTVGERKSAGSITLYNSPAKMAPPKIAMVPPTTMPDAAPRPDADISQQAAREEAARRESEEARKSAAAEAAKRLAEDEAKARLEALQRQVDAMKAQREASAQAKQESRPPAPKPEAAPDTGAGLGKSGTGTGGGGSGGGIGRAPQTAEQAPPPPGQPPAPAPTASPPPPPPMDGAGQTRGVKPVAKAADAEKSEPFTAYPVFFGTNRNREADRPRKDVTLAAFGGEAGTDLMLGQALVTIPKEHKLGGIERPEWTVFGYTVYSGTEDSAKHFTLKELKVTSRADFLAAVKARLTQSKTFKNRAFVFVHGYNVGFDAALYRTAQMAYDLSFDGTAFLFSWPSKGDYFGYVHDKDLALAARGALRRFLDLVLKETGAEEVDLIAHSMGNLPMLEALTLMQNDLRASGKPISPETTHIAQLVFAAPDVPRSTFQEQIADVAKLGRGVTLYASANDRALQAANTLSRGLTRAGEVPEPPLGPLIIGNVFDTIDVTATSTDFFSLNHSGFAERSPLLNDIALIFKTGQHPPDQRSPVLKAIQAATGIYWKYPQ